MKILLVCPKYVFTGYTPTGLVSIASIAESLGHEVTIVDMNIQKLPEKLDYDIVGITGLSLWKKSIIETSKIFKSLPVIVGGPWVSLSPHDALAIDSIDYVCMGEGEETFKEFLEKYPDVAGIKGIGYKIDSGKIILNESRPYIEDLDGLSIPSWHLLDLKKYKRVSLSSSRGCPFDCIFCAVHKFLGKKWRFRSVQSVLDEIELLVHLGVKHITFGDSNLTLIMDRFEKICDQIINRKIDVSFDVIQGVRADKLTPRLLEKMKKAGFKEVIIAPESGSQRVLNEIIGKKLDLVCIEPVVKKCQEIDLFCGAFFVIGFPWETRDEIDQTLRLAKRLRSYGCSTYIGNAIPIPGTELYYRAKKEGYLRFDGDELEDVIQSLGLPRKIHCLTSPYWGPEEIIKICKDEQKKNIRAVYGSYSLQTIISKFIQHPFRSFRKALRMI